MDHPDQATGRPWWRVGYPDTEQRQQLRRSVWLQYEAEQQHIRVRIFGTSRWNEEQRINLPGVCTIGTVLYTLLTATFVYRFAFCSAHIGVTPHNQHLIPKGHWRRNHAHISEGVHWGGTA